MKLKCIGFLFLAALIISGCSTTGSVSSMRSKSIEIQPKRIEQLERDMQEVKSRISAIETMLSGNSKTNEVVPAEYVAPIQGKDIVRQQRQFDSSQKEKYAAHSQKEYDLWYGDHKFCLKKRLKDFHVHILL